MAEPTFDLNEWLAACVKAGFVMASVDGKYVALGLAPPSADSLQDINDVLTKLQTDLKPRG